MDWDSPPLNPNLLSSSANKPFRSGRRSSAGSRSLFSVPSSVGPTTRSGEQLLGRTVELGGVHLPFRSVLAGQPAGRAGHLWLRQSSVLLILVTFQFSHQPGLHPPVAVLVRPLDRLAALVAGPDCYLEPSFEVVCNTTTNPEKPYLLLSNTEILELNSSKILIEYVNKATTCYSLSDNQVGITKPEEQRLTIDLLKTQYTLSDEN
ncbi:hypothetical protein SASPL_120510 [Salvia splendens]|uniref:Uncharacterized protein n=1 Tax=Salvia splendens TaxID=180675 RepID=A0A8X8ZU12_SALSN|nr:hypothetical protein SASPL_120510 [Salvia splendens]